MTGPVNISSAATSHTFHTPLAELARYYVSVTLVDREGHRLPAVSNGLVVDSAPPAFDGFVYDGWPAQLRDQDFLPSPKAACWWRGFTSRSSIAHYQVRRGTAEPLGRFSDCGILIIFGHFCRYFYYFGAVWPVSFLFSAIFANIFIIFGQFGRYIYCFRPFRPVFLLFPAILAVFGQRYGAVAVLGGWGGGGGGGVGSVHPKMMRSLCQ